MKTSKRNRYDNNMITIRQSQGGGNMFRRFITGIDMEIYSSADLPSCGAYRYVEAPDFTILLFAYSIDGGGVKALEAMGGSRMGLTEHEEKDITTRWRAANPHIVKLWTTIEKAAIRAIRTGESITINRGIVMARRWGMLTITLPSGSTICYPRAVIGKELNDGWRGDHDVIEYEGINQNTKKWGKIRTYGGKLTENIVQSIARDILGIVILRAHQAQLNTVFHIHDEIVVEAEPGQTLADVEALFSKPIEWCGDLPLKGAGYSTPYYLKD